MAQLADSITQMSPTDKNMPGIKGKRVPGRPGRFDPTMPLHMTTRRAAKTGPFYGTQSVNGSTEDDESRRGSMDDQRPITSYSNGSHFSAKSRRLSENSVRAVSPDNNINGIYSSQDKDDRRSESRPFSPVQQSPSPSRKRKRSPSIPPESTTPQQPTESMADSSFENYNDVPMYDDEADAIDVIPREDLSDREQPASQASSSEELMQINDMQPQPSVDATPAMSGAVSPDTSPSNSQEDAPLAKPLGAALEEVAQAAQAAQDDQDEQDDAMEIVEDVEDAEEVDDQVRSDDDGRPRRGRFGGRRRAKHHIPKVERAMQRQSELKSAYRAIARAQKAVLAEIAQRTVDDLEANAELHTQANEYEDVKAGLEEAYEGRQSRLKAQHEMNMGQMNRTLEAQQMMLKAQCRQSFETMQDELLEHLEYEMLRIARAAQLDGEVAGNDTEDEDDVIPRPKQMGYKWKRGDALDSTYDSRSRLSLETVRATKDLEKRLAMHKLLEEIPEEDRPKDFPGFTVGNSALRDVATEKREGLRNANTLAEAAAEIERISKIPIIRNEDAHGLQMLGDLASRPSIHGSVPPPSRSEFSQDSVSSPTAPRLMPPHLQIQINHGPSRIPVEMSPRTTQALGDRFDTSMPPPLTPRQATTPYIRSPEAMRTEFPMASPLRSTSMSNGPFHWPSARSDSRPHSQSGSFSERHGGRIDNPLSAPEKRSEQNTEPFRLQDIRRSDLPLWREYPRAQPQAIDRQMPRQSDESPSGALAREDRQATQAFHLQKKREERDAVKNESSSPFGRFHHRPPLWPDRPRQFRGMERRDATSPVGGTQRSAFDRPRSPRSRKPSTNFSVHDFHGDRPNRVIKNTFPPKTNKEERGGASRRGWPKDYRKLSGSLPKPGPASAASPSATSPPYASSPVDRTAPPPPWQPAPRSQNSPLGPPPPSAYGQTAPYGQPPQQHYPASTHGYEYDQHRNSFPPPPQPPASIWNQPSPSPLYAVPQQPPPPPPGVPPEQYSRFGPPPPPNYQSPQPPQTSQTPHPNSASAAFPHRFGQGPPLAPATTNPGYHPPGFRPAHPPPAFAQQAQQQQQSSFGHRRRTQSDVSYPKFNQWQPPSGRR